MKKFLLFSACVMLVFSSCKKSAPKTTTSANTITANIGNASLNFNTGVTALLASNSGVNLLLITGTTGTGSNAHAISIEIESENPIVKGTYTLNSSTSPDATTLPQISYGETVSATNQVSFTTDPEGTNVSTVTITSLSNNNVQGTFSGVLLSDQDGTTTQSVTDGKFNVALATTKQP